MKDLFKKKEMVTSDGELEALGRLLDPEDGWIFRGHEHQQIGLTTSLELACGWHGLNLAEAPEIEKRLLREFGRRAHLYLKDSLQLPDPWDTLEWISLMRHYGAPTRVLDWTYSIFVAAHFALHSSKEDKDCYIWAIKANELNGPALQKTCDGNRIGSVRKSGEYFRQSFMADPPNVFVSTVTPYRLNDRLAIQRGVFLCPGDVTKSFRDNLAASATGVNLCEITICKGYRLKLNDLLIRLNIDQEVLFPGLQGMATALKGRLRLLHTLTKGELVKADWIGRSAPREEEPKRVQLKKAPRRRARTRRRS